MRPVLAIAPYFAPQAAVGALRSVKLARRLPQLGFRPVVLCGSFPDDARDPSLAVPEGAIVHDDYLDPTVLRLRDKARRLRQADHKPNGKQLRGMDPVRAPIDRYAIHAVHAAKAAVRLGRRHQATLVYASLGPYSAAPVALRAASSLQVPCVLDLRDPWALHEASAGAAAEGARHAASARLVALIERACLRRASHVVLNTEAALRAYRGSYPWLETRTSCIRNCFDMELYRPARHADRSAERFRIIHLGRLRSDTPIDSLARALARLVGDGRIRPDELELVQVGYLSEHERGVLARAGLSSCLRPQQSVPYAETLELLQSCHLAVLLNAQSWRLRIPAKTYDYAASGMPILAISPNEELDQLLGHRAGYRRAPPEDVPAIADAIASRLEPWRRSGRLPDPLPPPEELSAAASARALAGLFEALCAQPRPA